MHVWFRLGSGSNPGPIFIDYSAFSGTCALAACPGAAPPTCPARGTAVFQLLASVCPRRELPLPPCSYPRYPTIGCPLEPSFCPFRVKRSPLRRRQPMWDPNPRPVGPLWRRALAVSPSRDVFCVIPSIPPFPVNPVVVPCPLWRCCCRDRARLAPGCIPSAECRRVWPAVVLAAFALLFPSSACNTLCVCERVCVCLTRTREGI